MTEQLNKAIEAVKSNQYSFCKFISANDAGDTGAHQGGLYIPKNSIKLMFDKPGIRGENLEKIATINWFDGTVSDCRFIYYGKGTRNEYRITRLGRHFEVGDFVLVVKRSENEYLGFVFNKNKEKEINEFLNEFDLTREETNSLISLARKINFRPKAHILVLLGEELIKSPVMAIYELIKNGYDADAKDVNVIFENIEDIDNTKIIITDSGTGITEEVLQNVWFEPGSDFRKPLNSDGTRQIIRSPIFNRIPMGEKGIGRFAVHKLGHEIKLISRPAEVIIDEGGKVISVQPLDYEINVEIDWRTFSQSRYLEDVDIFWEKNTNPATFKFKKNHGTYIEIGSLKEAWTRGMARQLKRNTISMVSPKNDISKFKINLDFKNWWLEGFPETEEILKTAPYKLSVFVDANYNMTFEYSFRLDNNSQIGSREINKDSTNEIDKLKYDRNIKGELKPFYRRYLEEKEFTSEIIENKISEFDSDHHEIPFGNLLVEIYSFDLDSISLRDYSTTPSLVKSLLRDHAGIKVFKGNLRVYDYGDPGNDWLGLDIKRVNNKTWFSNNQNVGYIYLDDETSGLLIEKTNREGFIHTDAFDQLLIILDFILNEFKTERLADREKWLTLNKKGSGNSFESQLTNFRILIDSIEFKEDGGKQKLLVEAENIEKRYTNDKNTLLIPAGVGMTASFAMHEIEKLVPRMEESVYAVPLNTEKITNEVEELKDYTEGLLSVLKKGGNKPISLIDSINQAINNYSSRIRNRKINIEINHDASIETIVCDKRLLITMLMNLIDNSIYWLDTVYKDNKGIYISTRRQEKGISILFVDNGPGFKDNIEDIVRPFFTRKEGGIGIGMYLIDTVMMQYGKLNIVNDREYLNDNEVPSKYDGAAVELIFNKDL